MKHAEILLPWPTRMSQMFSNAKQTRYTDAFKTYRRHASNLIEKQDPIKISGPVCLTMSFLPPTNHKRGITNFTHAVIDVLVHKGIIEGATSVTSIHADDNGVIKYEGERGGVLVLIHRSE